MAQDRGETTSPAEQGDHGAETEAHRTAARPASHRVREGVPTAPPFAPARQAARAEQDAERGPRSVVPMPVGIGALDRLAARSGAQGILRVLAQPRRWATARPGWHPWTTRRGGISSRSSSAPKCLHARRADSSRAGVGEADCALLRARPWRCSCSGTDRRSSPRWRSGRCSSPRSHRRNRCRSGRS